jgi:RimJ/RimL family protein N-acetyltransferase
LAVYPATQNDRDAIWEILKPMIREGATYALPADMSKQQALEYWFADDKETFVWRENGAVLGTYFLKANQQGGGAHVANSGYVTAPAAQGRGIARQMCLVSTNERAIKLWANLGFEIVGRLPLAFEHPTLGFVDALIMYRQL